MTTKDTLGVRVLKHGICALTMVALLAVAGAMVGEVFQRSVANITMQTQNVNALTFE